MQQIADRNEEEEKLGYYENWISIKELKAERMGRTPHDCFKKIGGSTEKEWNKVKFEWKCYKCKYTSITFLVFIPS